MGLTSGVTLKQDWWKKNIWSFKIFLKQLKRTNKHITNLKSICLRHLFNIQILCFIQSNLCWQPTTNNYHLSTTTTILKSRFPQFENKVTYEQRPPINNGQYFGSQGWSLYSEYTCKCILCYLENIFLYEFLSTSWLVLLCRSEFLKQGVATHLCVERFYSRVAKYCFGDNFTTILFKNSVSFRDLDHR